jgi:hypothetical protein
VNPIQTKHIIIDFGTIPLSAVALNKDAGEKEEFKMHLMQYKNKTAEITNSAAFDNPVEHWAIWEVARTDMEATSNGPIQTPKKKTKLSKAAQLFNGMSAEQSK